MQGYRFKVKLDNLLFYFNSLLVSTGDEIQVCWNESYYNYSMSKMTIYFVFRHLK